MANKIILADERLDGITKSNLKLSAWTKFKVLYGARPSISRSNITMLIYFVPLLLVILLSGTNVSAINAMLPFGGYGAVGYPLSLYAPAQAAALIRENTKTTLLLAAGGLVIFSIALAGSLKVIRNGILSIAVNKEGYAVSAFNHKRDNLRGMRENLPVTFLVALVWAAAANGVFYLFIALEGMAPALAIAIQIAAILLAALLLLYGFYVMCLWAGYRQRLGKVLKNAFFMMFQNMRLNIVGLLITLAPVSLLFTGQYIIDLLVLMYHAMIGFAVIVYTWLSISIKIENKYPKYKTVKETAPADAQ